MSKPRRPDSKAAAKRSTRGARAEVAGVRAVRGAITAAANTQEAILDATRRLLETLVEENGIATRDIVSAIFTVTADLDAEFPAHAARRLGWSEVPLLCAREIDVKGSLPRVIRVLLTVSPTPAGIRLQPAYMDGAAALRPDLGPQASPPTARSGAARTLGKAPARTRTVALIGLGQIGGSIGLALGRHRGWQRVGFDLDRSTLENARTRGAFDRTAPSLAAACAGAELAVIAVPVDAMSAAIDAAAAALPKGAALVDTASARKGVTDALERAARRGVRAIGGHPLAGTEARGIAAARADLFDRTAFVVCPVGETVPPEVTAMIRDLGATPLVSDPDRHDRALARTSHLPYLLACALRDVGSEAAAAGLAGPSFRDGTRVAASDPRMALAYCRANAGPIADAWHELRARLDAEVAGLEPAK